MKKRPVQEWIAIAAAISVVTIFFFVPLFISHNTSLTYQQELSASIAADTSSKLGIVDVHVGTGTPASIGDTVAIRYTATLKDGTVFSATGDKLFSFTLGGGKVIEGLDSGIRGMRVSGRRTVTIPPGLGYGSDGFGPIPPNAILIFDIELVSIMPPGM